MTVRLLKPYAGRPANAITSVLDASTEAGLIAAGQASADLTGGVRYYAPKPGFNLQAPQIAVGAVSLKTEEQCVCSLPEGQVLKIVGGAGAVGEATRTGTTDKWTIGAGTVTIGPYSGMQRIPINCTAGSIDATVGDAVLGILNLVNGQADLNMVAFGDSIAWMEKSVTATTSDTNSWSPIAWVPPLSFQRIQILANYAVPGNGVWSAPGFTSNLAWQIDQHLASPQARTANSATIMVGTNDHQRGSPEDTALELQQQLTRLPNIEIHLSTIYPKGVDPISSFNHNTELCWDGVTKFWEWGLRYNRLLAIIAANSGGRIILVDSHSAAADPTSLTDLPLVGALVDGVHPTNRTSMRDAKLRVAAASRRLVSSIDWIRSAAEYAGNASAGSGAKPMNLTSNSLFTSAGSGGQGYGWSVVAGQAGGSGATATPTLVASPTGIGQAQHVVAVGNANAGSGSNLQSAVSGHSYVQIGDTLYAQAYIKVAAGTGCKGVRIRQVVVIGGVSYINTCLQDDNVTFNRCVDLVDGFEGLWRTPVFKISTLPTQTSLGVFQVGLANANVTYDVAHAEIRATPAAMTAAR